jgi:hypothetical protein
MKEVCVVGDEGAVLDSNQGERGLSCTRGPRQNLLHSVIVGVLLGVINTVVTATREDNLLQHRTPDIHGHRRIPVAVQDHICTILTLHQIHPARGRLLGPCHVRNIRRG